MGKSISDRLDYDGNVLELLINWMLLLAFVIAQVGFACFYGKRMGLFRVSFLVFLSAILVQICCWYAFDTEGISAVWCFMAGSSVIHLAFTKKAEEARVMWFYLELVATIAAVASIIVYASTNKWLSTASHIISVVGGIVLALVIDRYCSCQATQDAEPQAERNYEQLEEN